MTKVVAIETEYVALMRARRFAEARTMLAGLETVKAELPQYRFVNAYLAVRAGDCARALVGLTGLEEKIPELAPDILRLRAEAELQTPDALVGAAWLDDHGRMDGWLDAARHLVRLGREQLALEAIEKGLARNTGRNGLRTTQQQAELRSLRIEIESKSVAQPGALQPDALQPDALQPDALQPDAAPTTAAPTTAAPTTAAPTTPAGGMVRSSLTRADAFERHGFVAHLSEDLRWLAVESPDHVGTRDLVAKLLERGVLTLDGGQRILRLRRLADAGAVEHVDREVVQVAAKHARLLPASLVAYLRGRARQVARREQLAGANLLERAAELNADNAVQLRIDAARLHVREGSLAHALRLYDRVAELDRGRREEALFYAARAAAVLGEPKRGIARFAELLERFPNGRFRGSAELERTLAMLALGDVNAAEVRLVKLIAEPAQREVRPRLLELAGLSAFLLARKDVAIERWNLSVKEAPFGVAGVFAAKRLVATGESVPPFVMDPTLRERSDPPPLSRRTNQLLAFGIDELAADAYRSESSAGLRTDSAIANGCSAWARIGYGERGFALSRAIREDIDLASLPTRENAWKWDCRFPRPYLAMVEEFESRYRLPKHLLHAVMRQESSFDPAIMSPVGALGLMQLMPQTARRLAEELHLSGPVRLDEPRENLRLGAAYLRKLLDAFEQNLVLAVAAYNAGPQAVLLWQRHAGSSAVELLAARIPYIETQKYVERVISNLLVYRYLGGLDRDFEGLSLTLPKELKDSSSLY